MITVVLLLLAALPVVWLMLGDWLVAAGVVLVVIKCLVLSTFSAAMVGHSRARGAWLDLDWVMVFHVGVAAVGSLCTSCERVWVIIEQTTFLMLVVCLKRLVQRIFSTRMLSMVLQYLSRGRIRCTLDCWAVSRTCLITRECVQLRCLQTDTVWYFVSDPFSHTSIVIVSKRRLLQCDLLCLRPVRLWARLTALRVSALLRRVALLLVISCLGFTTSWDVQVVVLLWSQPWHHLQAACSLNYRSSLFNHLRSCCMFE